MTCTAVVSAGAAIDAGRLGASDASWRLGASRLFFAFPAVHVCLVSRSSAWSCVQKQSGISSATTRARVRILHIYAPTGGAASVLQLFETMVTMLSDDSIAVATCQAHQRQSNEVCVLCRWWRLRAGNGGTQVRMSSNTFFQGTQLTFIGHMRQHPARVHVSMRESLVQVSTSFHVHDSSSINLSAWTCLALCAKNTRTS